MAMALDPDSTARERDPASGTALENPVAHQIVDRHLERSHTVLELLDQVLLITALVGEEDDLLGRGLQVVRHVEEVPDVVEELLHAPRHGEILPGHHHAVGPVTMARLVVELGHVLGLEADRLELALHDDPRLDLLRTGPRLRLPLVLRRPLELSLCALGKLSGLSLELVDRVEAEDEADAVPRARSRSDASG
jgi:hypothetical protein